jgi:citrate synthase
LGRLGLCNCFGHIERIEFSNPASTPRGARAVRAGEIRRQRLERRAATITTLAKAKKSVALSGVPAGNTALCTVGRTGDDLHYRGYDILDLADRSQFEEGAPADPRQAANTTELTAYKGKLRAMRGLPASVKAALESPPANAHPMDVMRTGVSAARDAATRDRKHRPSGRSSRRCCRATPPRCEPGGCWMP